MESNKYYALGWGNTHERMSQNVVGGGGEVGIEGRETGRDGRKREWRESRGRLGTWWEAGEKKRGGERRRGKE